MDESFSVEGLYRQRHNRPVHAKHDGKKPVRERYPLSPNSIARHEQPAGQALVQLAAAVGECRLRGLD